MHERKAILLWEPEKRPSRSATLVAAAIRDDEYDTTRAVAGRMDPAGPRALVRNYSGLARGREGLPRR